MFYKKSTYISILLFFVGCIVIIWGINISLATSDMMFIPLEDMESASSEKVIKARDENKVDIKLSFIGDSLIGSLRGENYFGNFRDLLENNNYSFPYKNVSNIFKEDDYTIANGENVFTDRILLEFEKGYTPAYWYYAPSRFANIYKESSIEIVSVMNNHTYDYGYEGYIDTMNAIKNAGVTYGEEDPVILEKDGIKIGLLCINLFSRFQYDNCVNEIKKIKNNVDYVIVYFHGGIEYSYSPSYEIVEYSRGFIDNGADLVIGCHPHVLEPIETYKNKKIVYSLGSFLFGGTKYFVNRTAIYQMNLSFNLDKNIVEESDNIIPCYLYTGESGYDSWIPSVIENESEKKRVLDFMNGLVESPI